MASHRFQKFLNPGSSYQDAPSDVSLLEIKGLKCISHRIAPISLSLKYLNSVLFDLSFLQVAQSHELDESQSEEMIGSGQLDEFSERRDTNNSSEALYGFITLPPCH